MHVQKFLRDKGVQALTDELGIKTRVDGDFLTLNYCQINSPKTDPVVMECRGLTLHKDTFEVISRGMDRFFNLGEALNVTPEINWAECQVFEKLDGSFIKIYKYKGKWYIATRGTPNAETDCMGYGITFKELVLKALECNDDEEFQEYCDLMCLNPEVTYMFELTCVENRVVKHYTGYNLTFLCARYNMVEYEYSYCSDSERRWIFSHINPENKFKNAKRFSFGNETECLEACKVLKDLDEGYIVYQNGVPVTKIKSPAYVAIHHIRGEGLNNRRCIELVLSGEVDEYLSYFETDRHILEKYIDAYTALKCDILTVHLAVKGIEDQKEFAKAVAKYDFKACLFMARRDNIHVFKAFDKQRLCYRSDQLEKYLK